MVSEVMRVILTKLAGLPLLSQVLLTAATTVFVIDLALKYTVRRSRVYAVWTKGLRAIGNFWTAIILAVVYFVPIGLTHLIVRAMGRDILDREIRDESSLWRVRDLDLRSSQEASLRQF